MEKEQFLALKETLKRKAQEQKEVKAQRKTENFKGERTIPAYAAVEEAQRNRAWLDKMYVVYYMAKHRMEFIPVNRYPKDELERKAIAAKNDVFLKEAFEKTHGKSVEDYFVYNYQRIDYMDDLTHLAHEIYKMYEKTK